MKGSNIKTGYLLGTGAAVNVSLGWSPARVTLYNLTDPDIITDAFLTQVIAFTSGGTNVIAVGDTIIGATSGAKANVRQVMIASGTFAGGDAAGYFVVDKVIGTFASENVKKLGNTDDATVTAIQTPNLATTTAVAGATGTSAISRYEGVAGSAAPGFTIGSVINETGKLLWYVAYREDD